MRLSVITNTKDEGPRVLSTCQAFLDAGADEIIVCADGTTDGSCDNLPDGVKVVRSTKSEGCGRAKLKATAVATGDVLMWVDAHQNIIEGNIRDMAQRALTDDVIVSPALGNIQYDESWNPVKLGAGRLFYPNDVSILPASKQQYSLTSTSRYAVGVGVCMSRKTYNRVGGWNRFTGRHGSQERGMALRAYMADVPTMIDTTTVFGHEFFSSASSSRNASTGQYRFNNIVPAHFNIWHSFMAVCSPPLFDGVVRPWLESAGLKDADKATAMPAAIQDRDYFLRHCKRRPDGDLFKLLSHLVAEHSPPADPGTAALEPMALSFIRSYARGRCLECGTGSTNGTKAILAGALSIVSIDHMQKFTDEAAVKLPDERVTFTCLPRAANGFYDLSTIEGKFDFILLDGPPGTQARAGGIQSLIPLLAQGGVLLVDDANRDIANIERARAEVGFTVEMLPTRRGLAKITLKSA